MVDNTYGVDADDARFVRRLVAHRVPELSEDQITAAFAPDISAEVAEVDDLVLEALDAMAERLDQLEMKPDDSRHARRPSGRDRAVA